MSYGCSMYQSCFRSSTGSLCNTLCFTWIESGLWRTNGKWTTKYCYVRHFFLQSEILINWSFGFKFGYGWSNVRWKRCRNIGRRSNHQNGFQSVDWKYHVVCMRIFEIISCTIWFSCSCELDFHQAFACVCFLFLFFFCCCCFSWFFLSDVYFRFSSLVFVCISFFCVLYM